MSSYNRILKETRQARVPLARISNELQKSVRKRRRKAVAAAAASLVVLTLVSTAVIALRPLASYTETLAALQPVDLEAIPDASGSDRPVEAQARLEADAAPMALEPANTLALDPAPGGDAVEREQLAAEEKLPSKDRDVALQEAETEKQPSETASVPPVGKGVLLAPFDAQTAVLPAADAQPRVPLEMPGARAALQDAPQEREDAQSSDTRVAVMPGGTSLPLLPGLPVVSPSDGFKANTSRYAAVALNAAVTATETSCETEIRTMARTLVINFDKGSASVPFRQTQQLRGFAKAVAACPAVKIDVGGHADKSGEQLGNLQLSWQRAEAVIASIKSLGFAPAQFSPVGFSATRPLVSDSSQQAQALNRRVEFSLR